MAFRAGFASTAERGRIYAVAGQSLHVVREGGAARIEADPSELAEAGRFAPDALTNVPPKLSIARELIDDFPRRTTK